MSSTTPSTPQTKTTSKQFTIDLSDLGKGLLMAILAPTVLTIYNSLQAGSATFNWKQIGITAGAAGLAYLIKNFLTPSQTIIQKP